MSSSHVAVGDVSLKLTETGDGPTLLFLHGEDGLIFSHPVIEVLAEGFRVIAPEHPGWGESTRPAYVDATQDLGAVYAELLEQLDGPVTIVGCSFGGWVAAETALQARVPLAALVLVAPIGIKIGDREERDYVDIWAASFDELPRILYGDPSRAPELAGRTDEEYLSLARAQEAVARYCWTPYMHSPRLRHWLRRVPCPSLVLSGTADCFTRLPAFYETYASLIGPGGAEHRAIDGAGHRIEEEEPAELVRHVRAFLAEHVSDATALAAPTGAR
jgi:pimeloyl-ACP methyl ester carboxylesterase